MDTAPPPDAAGETVLTRFWASARQAAGTDQVRVPVPGPVTLAELVELAIASVRRDEASARRLAEVLEVCSVLVGDRPHGRGDRSAVVQPGSTVEFLPPFAGG